MKKKGVSRKRPIRKLFDFLNTTVSKIKSRTRCGDRVLSIALFLGYLGAAAGLGAKGLVPARAVDVVIAVPLELEQHHVGQAVGGVPAVLVPDRF